MKPTLRQRPAQHRTCGSATTGTFVLALAAALFIAPFLRAPDGMDDTTAEGWVDWQRAAVNDRDEGPFDFPFEEDVRDCEAEYELELASVIAMESEARFGLDSTALAATGLIDVERVRAGRVSFEQHCSGCHGTTGDGGGPAARYLKPRPRNFRKGLFKFTSTDSGSRPLREDLFGTLTRGLVGSSMPDFRLLSEEKRWDLVEYVRYLAIRGEFEQLFLDFCWEEGELVDANETAEIVVDRWSGASMRPIYPASLEPDNDAASIERGREIYLDGARANCAACHGDEGRGDGPSATAFEDAWGYPVQPRDLTSGVFRAGSRAADLYRSIATGINGTPMPAFAGSITPDEMWDLTHFVQSLGNRD